jgi:hypothetical protein
MRATSKKYALITCVFGGITFAPTFLGAQETPASGASQQTCAGLLADAPEATAIGPGTTNDSGSARVSDTRAGAAGVGGVAQTGVDTTLRTGGAQSSLDTAAFGIGGARSGKADVVLWVGVHADQVRFASQPHVRVRLCWGGDTLRVVQRTNIPSPVVAGTTYRNVYVAVELVGRLNGQCLADAIGVGNRAAGSAPESVSNCAFIGGNAGAGAQTTRPPAP